ncbi:MAG: PAS domain S-box protein [Lautropia sp.]
MQTDPRDAKLTLGMPTDAPARLPEGMAGFFGGLSVPAALVDASLHFCAINPAFESVLGYTSADIVGRHVLDLYDPATLGEVRAHMASLIERGIDAVQVERHLLSRGGERLHAKLRVSRYVEAGRDFYAVLFEDVNRTDANEAMLVSRSEVFRVTIERSPIPTTVQDSRWRFVLVNQAFCELIGYELHELIGRDPIDFMHSPDLHPEILRQREIALRAAEHALPRYSSIRRALRRDGREVVYRLELDCMRGLDGKPLWCGMAIDISHIAQAQADLDRQVAVARRMQTRFEAFAGSLDEAVVVVSPDGDRVLHANAATEDVFGIDPARLVGNPLPSAWGHASVESRHALADAYRRMTREGQAEVEASFAEGGAPARIVRTRFFRSGDSAPEYFVLAEDVTQRRRRQHARLDEALKQRETLVREIHHRIKNNLQGAAGLLERAAARQPETREALRDVAQQIHAIAKVHGLQVQSGRLLRPGDVAASIAEQLGRNFGRAISIEAPDDAPGDAPVWLLPESQAVAIALVMNELLTNALKHASAGSAVSMTVRQSAQGFELSIRNDGVLAGAMDGDDDAQGPGRGLQMMRQLLPMRGSDFDIVQDGASVVATLRLSPPALQAEPVDPAPRAAGHAAPPVGG